MKTISVPTGEQILIDDADYAWASERRWWLQRGYVATKCDRRNKYLHRLLMGAAFGQEVDHIDGDPLNNQRANLRLCTHAENMRNRLTNRKKMYSRYKGVTKTKGYWVAYIRGADGRQKHLGSFPTEEAAARAYDAASIERYGAFAKPNFPPLGFAEVGAVANAEVRPRTNPNVRRP